MSLFLTKCVIVKDGGRQRVWLLWPFTGLLTRSLTGTVGGADLASRTSYCAALRRDSPQKPLERERVSDPLSDDSPMIQ